jgi:hypothetical protein
MSPSNSTWTAVPGGIERGCLTNAFVPARAAAASGACLRESHAAWASAAVEQAGVR